MRAGADLKVNKKTLKANQKTRLKKATPKKAGFKKVCWFLVGLVAVVAFFILLLLHKPNYYNPPETAPANNDQSEVSPYLTHVLSPQLYNGAQRREPFDLVVVQEGINDIIAGGEWPKETDGIRFLMPGVFFVPDNIILMGTVVAGGAELVVTIVGRPVLDDEGLLNLKVTKVRVGVVNVTFLAKVIAERIYKKQPGRSENNAQSLEAKIAGSLLSNEPFEPVFEIDDKKVRIKKIAVEQKKLTVSFVPVWD